MFRDVRNDEIFFLPLYFVIYSAADFDLKASPRLSVHVLFGSMKLNFILIIILIYIN
jgi:hypothetical protein